jgi:hypothetical protein
MKLKAGSNFLIPYSELLDFLEIRNKEQKISNEEVFSN